MLEEQLNTDCGRAIAASDETIQEALEEIRREGGFARNPAAEDANATIGWDVLFETYVNGLLSSPTTHGVNFVSNMIPLATRVIETMAAATSSKLFRTRTNRIAYREAIAEVSGMAEGTWDALRFMNKRLWSLTSGSTNEQLLDFQHLPKQLAIQSKIERKHQAIAIKNPDDEILKTAINWMGNTVNIPGGALSTSDTFFKIINYRATVAKQAMRRAVNQSEIPLREAYTAAKQAAYSGEDAEIIARGIQDADIRTYTNEPYNAINRWMAVDGHTMAGMRWIVPFRRAVVNIMEYAAGRTPLPLLNPPVKYFNRGSKTWQALRSGDAAVRDEAIGRMAAGSAIATALFYSVGDRLTGSAPRDAQQRDLWERNGNKEYSIKISDTKHVDLDMLGPYGTLLRGSADYQRHASNIDSEHDGQEVLEELNQVGAAFVLTMADLIQDEHWVSNISGGSDALTAAIREGSTKPLEIYAAKYAAGFVPNIMRSKEMGLNKRIDPFKKEIGSPMDYFISQLPVFSQLIEPKIDFWGEPMLYDNFLDPDLKSNITGNDPVAQEVLRLNLSLDKPSRAYMGVQMTNKEYTAMMIYAGKGSNRLPPLREELAARIVSPLYKQFNTDQGRADYIKDAILTYRQAARLAVIQDPRFDLKKRLEGQMEINQQVMGISR